MTPVSTYSSHSMTTTLSWNSTRHLMIRRTVAHGSMVGSTNSASPSTSSGSSSLTSTWTSCSSSHSISMAPRPKWTNYQLSGNISRSKTAPKLTSFLNLWCTSLTMRSSAHSSKLCSLPTLGVRLPRLTSMWNSIPQDRNKRSWRKASFRRLKKRGSWMKVTKLAYGFAFSITIQSMLKVDFWKWVLITLWTWLLSVLSSKID